jgi:hypothetical protein
MTRQLTGFRRASGRLGASETGDAIEPSVEADDLAEFQTLDQYRVVAVGDRKRRVVDVKIENARQRGFAGKDDSRQADDRQQRIADRRAWDAIKALQGVDCFEDDGIRGAYLDFASLDTLDVRRRKCGVLRRVAAGCWCPRTAETPLPLISRRQHAFDPALSSRFLHLFDRRRSFARVLSEDPRGPFGDALGSPDDNASVLLHPGDFVAPFQMEFPSNFDRHRRLTLPGEDTGVLVHR